MLGKRLIHQNAGFTLIELLVVVVIIGVLASVVGPRFFGKTEQAKISAARAQIENFSIALDSYQLDTGAFPTTEQGLAALVTKTATPPEPKNWRGPYLRKKEIPSDPWGNPYLYEYPAKNGPDFDLLSYGKNGQLGGTGDDADITNW
ncbi:MAG: type II secretion system major pseudopilin GspG [Desulfobacterales bacterium]|nr:type II secretion system major pseudopilin GspG [Desulfobacterales bacterium]